MRGRAQSAVVLPDQAGSVAPEKQLESVEENPPKARFDDIYAQAGKTSKMISPLIKY
jgi:hypothetical protein